jgi:hypothetical protein
MSSKSATYKDPFKPAAPQRRKTGSRAKLAKRFFEDIYAAWEEQGESVIARVLSRPRRLYADGGAPHAAED